MRLFFQSVVLFVGILFFNGSVAVVGSGGNVSGQTHFTDIGEFFAGGPLRIDAMRVFSKPGENLKKKVYGCNVFAVHAFSTNNDKIAQFLMPRPELLLTATGGSDYFVPYNAALAEPTNKVVRDIDASVLGVADPDFSSLVRITPSSKISYLGFFGYYTFSFNEDSTPRLSLWAALPVMSVFHKIVGEESVQRFGSARKASAIKSILGGLSRDELHFQRWNFSSDGMRTTSIPSLELDLAYNYRLYDRLSLETYAGFLCPLNQVSTSNFSCDKKNEFIFSPELVNANHFGAQYGITISVIMYENEERLIKFVMGDNLLYFFPRNFVRSFDLEGRSWSRYLYAYKNYQTPFESKEPLVNDLTLTCRVTPNFSNIATSEFHYIRKNIDLAAGYSLFSRQSESVTVLDDIKKLFIVGSNTELTPGPPVSMVRTIALRLPYEDVALFDDFGDKTANYYYANVKNIDLDISSATHPAVFAGELYGKFAYEFVKGGTFVGGLSYRFSHTNTAIEYATFWIGLKTEF
jgi:hypothetical protein